MTLDQSSSSYMIHKYLNSPKSISEVGQWYPVSFFSWKMILVETWYKTYNQEFLAIVETFKTWRYYLQDCKYEIFDFTN